MIGTARRVAWELACRLIRRRASRCRRGVATARLESRVPYPSRASQSLRERNEARCERILGASSPLVIDDLPWHTAGPAIDPQVIDALAYMRDVEGFTDRYLVGLAAHRTTLGDPLVRRFFDVWRAEEAGHTAALERFLSWYGDSHGREIPARQLPAPPRTNRCGLWAVSLYNCMQITCGLDAKRC